MHHHVASVMKIRNKMAQLFYYFTNYLVLVFLLLFSVFNLRNIKRIASEVLLHVLCKSYHSSWKTTPQKR